MPKFIVSDSFWELFPQAKIGIVLLKKFQSQKRSPKPIIELLKKSNELAKTYLVEDNFSDNAEIQVHRKAYQRFKTKKSIFEYWSITKTGQQQQTDRQYKSFSRYL